LLQERGTIATDEMLRAFNMGVGLVAVCRPDHVGAVLARLSGAGETRAWRLGEITAGPADVVYTAS
jgi:phosphoribosylformylglycinamidine cyclo-ligase